MQTEKQEENGLRLRQGVVVGGFVQRTKGAAVMVQCCSLFLSFFFSSFLDTGLGMILRMFLGFWAKLVLACVDFFWA